MRNHGIGHRACTAAIAQVGCVVECGEIRKRSWILHADVPEDVVSAGIQVDALPWIGGCPSLASNVIEGSKVHAGKPEPRTGRARAARGDAENLHPIDVEIVDKIRICRIIVEPHKRLRGRGCIRGLTLIVNEPDPQRNRAVGWVTRMLKVNAGTAVVWLQPVIFYGEVGRANEAGCAIVAIDAGPGDVSGDIVMADSAPIIQARYVDNPPADVRLVCP